MKYWKETYCYITPRKTTWQVVTDALMIKVSSCHWWQTIQTTSVPLEVAAENVSKTVERLRDVVGFERADGVELKRKCSPLDMTSPYNTLRSNSSTYPNFLTYILHSRTQFSSLPPHDAQIQGIALPISLPRLLILFASLAPRSILLSSHSSSHIPTKLCL
jgi:hypothetical protein